MLPATLKNNNDSRRVMANYTGFVSQENCLLLLWSFFWRVYYTRTFPDSAEFNTNGGASVSNDKH